MFRAKGRPWEEIVERYRSLVEVHKHPSYLPMLEFVRQLATSEFAANLYATTSMNTLCVSDLPEFDMDRELLRIDFDPEGHQFKFEYQETMSPLYKRWRKTSPPEDAFPAFVRFLKRKKWIRSSPSMS
jgi:hypothetical protein